MLENFQACFSRAIPKKKVSKNLVKAQLHKAKTDRLARISPNSVSEVGTIGLVGTIWSTDVEMS